ncbi:MAG: hypothetical protein ACPG06_08365 [Alphaproteobacteria bacterium]
MRTSAFVKGLSALLLIFAAGAVRADPIPVWWAAELAAPGGTALEAAFEKPLPQGPMILRGPAGALGLYGSTGPLVEALACEDVVDALDRNFVAVKAADKPLALWCAALGQIVQAAEAESSTFRRAPEAIVDGPLVPGGTPIAWKTESVGVLPAYLAPLDGCGFALLALRASDQFWSLARFAHVYGAGEKDDGRAADTVNGNHPRALVAKVQSDGGLYLRQNGQAATLHLLGLGDFDGDGAEDALIRKTDQAGAALHIVSQFRPGAVMRLRDLSDRYLELIKACPDLVLDFAAASEPEAGE